MKAHSLSQSLVVKLTAGQTDSVRVWNGRKPLTIGHPIRWTMERADHGVIIRTVGGAGSSRLVKDTEIEKTVSILLASGASNATFKMELKPVLSLVAAHDDRETVGSGLRVYHQKGSYTVDAEALRRQYFGRFEGKKIFKLSGNKLGTYSSMDEVKLKVLLTGVEVSVGTAPAVALKKGEVRSFARDQAAHLVIRYSGSEWRIAQFAPEKAQLPIVPVVADAEQTLMKRVLQGCAAAVVLLLLGSLVWPKPEEKKEEPVRILLAKKKSVKGLMTSAPKGDSTDFSMGTKGKIENAGRKGGAVQKPVAKTKPSKSTVKPTKMAAKPAAPKVSKNAPVKKVAKQISSAPKVAKVASPSRKAVPAPKSELFKTFSSQAFKKATQGLVAGGVSNVRYASDESASLARSMGSSRGSNGSSIGGGSGVSTRSASVSGFGGEGGAGDGGPGSLGAGYGRGSHAKVSGQGRSLISLDTGESDVDEGLTRDQVGRVIHAHMNEIRYCYESAVLRAPELEGRMVVQFSIGAPGAVQTAGLGSSTVSDRRLHDCIVSRLKTWKFPKPKGGVTVAVAYPFTFKTLTR